MARMVAEARRVIEPRFRHLEPMEVAAYVDRAAAAEVSARIEAHLAECAECRDEVVEASRISRQIAAPKLLRRRIWIPAAAAAVLVLLARGQMSREAPEHRESPVTTTVAPRAVAPIGVVDSIRMLTWSSVPRSDAYRVRLFGMDGTVLWDRETRDTTIPVPTAIALQPERTYFWKVEAQTGFGRTATTELIEFTVRHARTP